MFFCKCAGVGSFPLIVSGQRNNMKRRCMVSGCKRRNITCVSITLHVTRGYVLNILGNIVKG